ncbi:MAG: flagellar basal body rod protein FlgC [Fidelibacterota bacterium]
MNTIGIFSSLRTTLAGLSSQMKKLNVISENIANAEKLPDENGKVYHRKTVVVSGNPAPATGRSNFGSQMALALRQTKGSHIRHKHNAGSGLQTENQADSFKVVEMKGDKKVYDPSHPKADENGYVTMPNINTVEEMVDLVSASRLYEANISVMRAAKGMAKKALEI